MKTPDRGIFGRFERSGEMLKHEILRVDKDKGLINGQLTAQVFTDKDTDQIVYYIPALDISSYGETREKAEEMLKASIQDLFGNLLELSTTLLEHELRDMGWKQVPMNNKEYSKVFVDINGELQNFNAADDRVERLTLTL